jgi:O-antigen/teichoic acid export membrane protein
VLSVVLIFTLVVAGAELLPFLAVPIPTAAVVLVVTALLVRGAIPLAPAFELAEWRTLLRDVLPFAVATAFGAIYFRLAIVLLSLIASAEETGYFAAPFRVVEVLVVVPQLVVGAAFPIFARAARDDRARLGYGVQRMFEACTLLGGWIALCLAVGAGFIIEVIAGPDFEPSVPVLRIQAITVFAIFVGAAWSYALLSLHEHRPLLVISLITLVVNCTLVLVLGSSDGARGAAVGTFVADLIGAIGLGLVLARRHSPLRPSLGVLPKVLAAGALAGAPALVPGVPDVVLVAVAAVIFCLAAIVLRAVPEEIFVELRRLRGREGTVREDPSRSR